MVRGVASALPVHQQRRQPPLEARYVLEESASPNWLSSSVIYRGLDNLLPVYGRSTGSYYYRVRAEVGSLSSDWSNGVAVRLRSGEADLAGIVRALDAEHLKVEHLELHQPSLDDVFLAKTGRSLEGAGDGEADAAQPTAQPAA